MANYNEHKCFTCGQIFDYCRRCAVTPVVYKAEGFCSENCSHIFATLSKHGCNLITADEALTELAAYHIDDVQLTDAILAHIEQIKAEATPVQAVAEVTEVADEVVAQSNKKTKKKW